MPEISEPVPIFPSATLSVSPGEDVQVVAADLRSDLAPAFSFPVFLERGPEGSFAGTVTCPFIGRGKLSVRDVAGAVEEPPMLEVPVVCEPPFPTESGESTVQQHSIMSAPGTSSPTSVMTIPGVVEQSVMTDFSRIDNVTRFFNTQGNPTGQTIAFIERDDRWTRNSTEFCFVSTQREQHDVDEPILESQITQCQVASPIDLSFLVGVVSGTQQLTSKRSNGTVQSILDSTVGGAAMVTATILFPDIPEGAVVDGVRVLASDPLIFGNVQYTRPPDWMFPGSTLDEGIPEQENVFVSNCPDGVLSRSMSWTFPGEVVDAEGRFALSFPVIPSCMNQQSFSNQRFAGTNDLRIGALFGSLRFQADVRPQDLTLLLTTDAAHLAPRIPPTARFPGTAPETTVRATVTGGTFGDEVTVNLDVPDFDAVAGGHIGHTPELPPSVITDILPDGSPRPETGRGELVGGDDVLTSSCTLVLEDPGNGGSPTGTCEVMYKAGIVGGIATIRGQIAGSSPVVEDEVELDVLLPLADVSALFPRNGERFRGADTAEEHPGASFLDPRAIGLVVRLQRDWEMATKNPAHSSGTYLSLNDMSIARGGLFDIGGSWSRPHNSHRVGTSVDVNRLSKGPFDVDQQTQVTPADAGPGTVIDPEAPNGVRVDKIFFNIICERTGGFVVQEPSLHCEWRGAF